MRVIQLSRIAGRDYLVARRGRTPRGFGACELVARPPVPAAVLSAKLLERAQSLAEFVLGANAASLRSRAELEQLARSVAARLGHPLSPYQLWRVRAGGVQLDDVRLDPPVAMAMASEPPPEPEPATHWLELEVIDCREQSAASVSYELLLPDGERRSGNTDSEGRVSIQGIAESGHFKLSFPEVDLQGAAPEAAISSARPAVAYMREALSLPVDAEHLVRLPPELMQAHYIEFDDVFFSFNSTALLPETKDHTPPTNDEGEAITGLNLCMAVLQYAEQDPSRSLLILGHTDTVGSDADNVVLSQLRSQVVFGLVSGDREAFKQAVDAPHIKDKQTKAKRLIPDKNFVLDWIAEYTGWPCSLAENANDHWAATKQFQIHYNEHGSAHGGEDQLEVDRDFGPSTWAAVFDIYQDYIAHALELSHAELRAKQGALNWAAEQTKHTGCGEFHPLDAIGRDGIRSATNRRVEACFFDPGELPALECFAGGCAERQCALYDPTEIRRKPLPVSWKALWKVGWDRVSEPARMGEVRDIVLRAPKLEDGELVSFEIEQEVDGQRKPVATLEAAAEGERAQVSFGAWFDPARVLVRTEELGLDESFPEVRFHVRATAGDREVEGRRPLVYADTLQAQIQHELVSLEFESDFVDPAECLVHSPWGCKRAESDEEGWLVVEGLPPGGVLVTIDEDPYYED